MITPRHLVPRHEWDGFVADHPDGWCWHLSDWLDYLANGRDEAAYARQVGRVMVEIVPDCWPNERYGPPPLSCGWTGHERTIGTFQPLSSSGWRWQPVREPVTPGIPTRVVDLTRDERDIWKDIRRSYHSPIRRADELYDVNLNGSVDDLRALYAKRRDLPQLGMAQWDAMRRMHARGRLRVLTATFGEPSSLVGAIGIYAWKGWAYYGHGRSLQPPGYINHLLHWRAIKLLQREGVQHYEIGWEAAASDGDKARGIAFHKAGFGGETWWVPTT